MAPVGFYAQFVTCGMPVLMRSSIFRRVNGLKRSLGSMELELVVGLVLGLMVFTWYVEMFALLKEWSNDLSENSKITCYIARTMEIAMKYKNRPKTA